jgi:hypothetical protein
VYTKKYNFTLVSNFEKETSRAYLEKRKIYKIKWGSKEQNFVKMVEN